MLQTCNSHQMKAEKQSYNFRFWFRSIVLDIFWFEISKNFDVRRKLEKAVSRQNADMSRYVLGLREQLPAKMAGPEWVNIRWEMAEIF